MNRNLNKAMLYTAVAAGLGTLGAVGAMSMQKSGSHQRGGAMQCMMHRMSNVGEEFADEFCVMAHKTGNAMIRAGRMINRLVP